MKGMESGPAAEDSAAGDRGESDIVQPLSGLPSIAAPPTAKPPTPMDVESRQQPVAEQPRATSSATSSDRQQTVDTATGAAPAGAWSAAKQPKQRSSTANRSAAQPSSDQHVVFITGKTKNITKVNYVKLKHEIDKAFGAVEKVYFTGNDSLKLYCTNDAQKARVMRATHLGEHEITPSEPVTGFRQQNQSRPSAASSLKGVIVGVTHDITEEELAAETGVDRAVRITKTEHGRRVKTTAVLLVFSANTSELPEHVTVGYRRFRVRVYGPTPTRCYQCQLYGHTAKACKAHVTCPKCAGRHTYEECDKRQPKCANCNGAHSTAYKGCPSYKTAVLITKTAAQQHISYAAAAKSLPRTKVTTQQLTAGPRPVPVRDVAGHAAKPPSQGHPPSHSHTPSDNPAGMSTAGARSTRTETRSAATPANNGPSAPPLRDTPAAPPPAALDAAANKSAAANQTKPRETQSAMVTPPAESDSEDESRMDTTNVNPRKRRSSDDTANRDPRKSRRDTRNDASADRVIPNADFFRKSPKRAAVPKQNPTSNRFYLTKFGLFLTHILNLITADHIDNKALRHDIAEAAKTMMGFELDAIPQRA